VTRKELNLAIFEGTAEKVLWQPRLETWIGHHLSQGTMPERFRGMSSLEIYDALRCSVRYAASAGVERYEVRDDLIRIHEQHHAHSVEVVRTPVGEIRTVHQELRDEGRLKDDRRWKVGVPPASNANFAWVQHFIHHLAPTGLAGFVLANGSMSSSTSGEGDNRILSRNRPEEIEAMVREMVETAQMTGGYLMSIGNHIPWTIPPQAAKLYLGLCSRLAHR